MASHPRKTPADPHLVVRLRYAVLKAGMTASALAVAIGRTRGAVSHWMTGKFEPPPPMLRAIAEVTKVSREWLMGENLSPEEKEQERRRIEMLLKSVEGSPEDEAAAFLAEIERLGGISAVTQILIRAKRSPSK